MKIISLKCPNCQANISIEKGRDNIFCSYCGTQIFIDDETIKIKKHIIDEAKIKDVEANKEIRMRELDVIQNKPPTQYFSN